MDLVYYVNWPKFSLYPKPHTKENSSLWVITVVVQQFLYPLVINKYSFIFHKNVIKITCIDIKMWNSKICNHLTDILYFVSIIKKLYLRTIKFCYFNSYREWLSTYFGTKPTFSIFKMSIYPPPPPMWFSFTYGLAHWKHLISLLPAEKNSWTNKVLTVGRVSGSACNIAFIMFAAGFLIVNGNLYSHFFMRE